MRRLPYLRVPQNLVSVPASLHGRRSRQQLPVNFLVPSGQAQEAKPSARQIRIGLLRVAGTDPAIDRAIEARLVVGQVKSFRLGRNFSRRGGRRSATGTWWPPPPLGQQSSHKNTKKGGLARRIAIWFGDILFPISTVFEAKRQQAIARRDEWRNTLRKVFQDVDAIALPVLRKAPPKQNGF